VKGYGLHQDWIAWPGFPRSFPHRAGPIDASTVENGLHRGVSRIIDTAACRPRTGNYNELPLDRIDEARGVPLELEPGDVAIFGGFTPHRSRPTAPEAGAGSFILSYNKKSDGGEQRTKHYEEFHRWLRVKYAEYNKNDVYFE